MDAYTFAGVSIALVTIIIIMIEFLLMLFIYAYLKVGELIKKVIVCHVPRMSHCSFCDGIMQATN